MVSPYENRTAMLLGREAVERLHAARVLLFGLGGVGGAAAEALARAGVGALTVVDGDRVAPSNLNRQLFATTGTVGLAKTAAAAARLAQAAPGCRVAELPFYFTPETADRIDFSAFDYVLDAVDMVTAKLEIIARARAAGLPVISCMGTGNKLRPELLRLAVLEKTEGCPLARVMRRECRARGLKNVPVVYSPEPPLAPAPPPRGEAARGRATPGSVSFVPPAAGLLMAGKAVRDLCGLA